MFIKDPYQIMSEACRSECGECDDMYEDEVEQDFEDEYDDIDEIEDDIIYTAEMVTVIEHVTGSDETIYLVEMDQLAKFMESNNIEDIKEAMDSIAQENSLEESSMVLLIESQDYAEEFLNEAKSAKKKGFDKKLINIGNKTKILKNIKNKGIRVMKKKSKNSKKKSKKK